MDSTNRRFLDWASVLMYGHLPLKLKETVLALIAQLLWSGFLGVPSIIKTSYTSVFCRSTIDAFRWCHG